MCFFIITQYQLFASDQFIENKGQWDNEAKFLYKTYKKDIWITGHGMRTSIYNIHKNNESQIHEIPLSTPIDIEIFDIQFLNTNNKSLLSPIDKSEAPIHYIKENGVFTTYASNSIVQKGIYPNIDLTYYSNTYGELEFDFIVQPGAKISNIQTEIKGIENISVDAEGRLVLHTKLFDKLILGKPIAYQIIEGQKINIPVHYILNDHKISFQLEKYDHAYNLIIDPSLKYSTFLFCSSCEDLASDNDINPAGELVVSGYTLHSSFPTTIGAFQTSLGNANFINYDAFVTKMNATGTGLIFSTFLGGNSQDLGLSISYDHQGNIIIVGKTTSSNFPMNNALYNTYQGGFDGFVTKLNSTGNVLLISTFIGGNSFDECKSVTVDLNNNIYFTGNTLSTNLPISSGAIKPALSNPLIGILYPDGFVYKINAAGNALSFCTYLGGNNDDYMKQIKVDSFGNSYIIGNTSSTNYHTVNAYDNFFNGDIDGFITKLNPTGSSIFFSTFIGGNLKDYIQAIAFDKYNNIYVAGNTYSSGFPIVSPNFKSSFTNSGSDIFVSCLNPGGNLLKHSTFVGSGFLNGLAVNDCGYVFLSGFSFDANYPITPDALQKNIYGIDNIVTVLDSSLMTLAYSSFIGGNASDYGAAKISLLNNVFYYSGTTHSMNFPTTPGSFQTVKTHSNPTPFVTSIENMCFLPDPNNISVSPNTFCLNLPQTATLKAKPVKNLCASNNLSIHWYKNSNRTSPIAIGDSVLLLINPLDTYYVISYDNIYKCKSRDIKLTTNTANIVYNRFYTRCKGDSMYLSKSWRKISGIYFDTVIAVPCDSIIKSTLIISIPPYKKVNLDKCKGIPFVFNSKVYTVNGTYIDTIKNNMGCDSIVEFTLNFIESTRVDSIKICVGTSYTVGIQTYSANGIYRDTLLNYLGCDSIIITYLTVTNNKVYYVTKTLCSNQSYQVGLNLYFATGTYIDTFHLAGSCDSVIVSMLTFILAIQTLDTIRVCENDTFLLFGEKKIATNSLSGYQTKNFPNCTTKTSLVIIKPRVNLINFFVSRCDDKGYKIGNKTYYVSGFYIDTLKQVGGCDSIVESTVTIIPKPIPIIAYFSKTICANKSFTFNNKIYNTAGTYTDTLKNRGGCDSAYITFNLIVIIQNYKYIDTTLCQGQSVTIGLKIRSTSGLYKDTLVNSYGCDSVIETNLKINPIKNTILKDTFCQGTFYIFNGINRTASGTYYDTLKTYLNCDSFITLNLYMRPTKYTNLNIAICSGKSVLLGGQIRSVAGIYYDTITTSFSCDSVVISTLTIKPIYNISNNIFICSGNNYKVGTKTYTVSGLYHDTLQSKLFCDSIIHTNLIVSSIIYGFRNFEFCSGDSFFAASKYQKITGNYYDTTKTSGNCDSVTVTTLIFNSKYNLSITKNICLGDSIKLGGIFRKTNGVYIDNLKTIKNCDSIITTTLIANSPFFKTNNISICSNQTYFAEKQFRNTTGVYHDSFKTIFGCDSFVVTNLFVHNVYNSTNKVNICQGLSYYAGGKLQTNAGTYTDTYKTMNNCDSVVVTELSFLPSYAFLITKTICIGESFLFHGTKYDKNGVYLKHYINFYGCDSNYQLDLTVQKAKREISYQKICANDTLFLHNKIYFKEGTYFDTVKSFDLCDSIIELKLLFNSKYSSSQVINLCEGDSFKINKSYKKSNGYFLDTFISTFGCDSMVLSKLIVQNCDSLIKPLVPTGFSPNGDGINDLFRPILPSENISLIELTIFDRWGNKVFDSNATAQFFWDGKNHGSKQTSAVFIWHLVYKTRGKHFTMQGNVTLLD